MSILRWKQKVMFADGGVLRDSGGGGGGQAAQPTQSTSYNTNVPEYARPYVENMLQSTQKQIYNDDMTTFRPYQPYSSDVNNYFAGFSPLQQQAQSETANMQTPGQYGAATGFAGMAGLGGLAAGQQASDLGNQALGYGQAGSVYGNAGAQQALQAARQTGRQAGMYGMQGSMYGQQAADMAQQGYGAGANYAQQATDPYATQAYMSPYMQNVVDYQKSQAVRDYGIGQQGLKAQASRAGAFGGSRQAIQEAEAQRSLGSQLQGIEATGAQQAFQNAQQAQQFGANLGLQGLQAGYQGTGMGIQGAQTGLQGVGAQQAAGNLGLAGTAQGMQGAGYGLQGVQGALGAGQYGLQGYGLANTSAGQLASIGGQQQTADLARLQAQQQVGAQQQNLEQNKINQAISNYATAQQYPFMQLGIMNSMLRGLPLQQTTTSTYQQQPSTAQQLTGLGGAALSYLGKKEGGIIGMKEGGTVPGYKYGDLISDPQLQGMSQNLSPDQIQGRIADPQVTPNERGIFQGTQQAQQRLASNPMAAGQMAQSVPPPQAPYAPSDDARMGGIAQAGGDMFNTMGYAGGGIVAFETGDLVEEKPKTREGMLAQTQAMLEKQGFKPGASPDEQAYADMVAKQQAGLGEATSAKERANMAKAFLKMGANPRGFLPGAIEGAESYITGAGEIAAGKETKEMALAEARSKYSAAQRARASGDIAASDKLFHEAAQLENQAKIAAGNNAATLGAANIHAAASGKAQVFEEQAVQQYMKDHPGTTYSDAYQAVKGAGRAESVEVQRIAKAIELKQNQYITETKPEEKAKLKKEIADLQARLLNGTSPTSTPVAATPVQNKDGTITIPDQGTFKKLPNGNYEKVG